MYENDNVSFSCAFEGRPVPSVKWFCNDIEISSSDQFMIETKDTLSILDVNNLTAADSGEYKCVVMNDHGKDECIATLTVQCLGKTYPIQ